ncbi:hypothetical protein [Nocardia sp. CY41]|uniref:hypothetical protein n=1 Tax=Nocardia sp. CY41 TaxID=2608686 RepID=UPI001F40BCAB|nr:hypothetical protein [Nocardia sp. CY41]
MTAHNAPQRLEAGDTAERARFEAKVVRGPGRDDCWIWIGGIGDDGYGRFWIRRDGRAQVVRPPRYAVALYVGTVPAGRYAMHDECDNPICVRAMQVDDRRPHVVLGTQQQNLTTMGRRRRSHGGRPVWLHDGLTRAQRVARSRALREAVRSGWDEDAVRAAMLIGGSRADRYPVENGEFVDHPTLFDAHGLL